MDTKGTSMDDRGTGDAVIVMYIIWYQDTTEKWDICIATMLMYLITERKFYSHWQHMDACPC